jgi:hypothetical protein
MLTIKINDTGAAFTDNPNIEAARILREIADRLEAWQVPEVMRDINGNICTTIELDPMSANTGE